ncbi:ABC transporter ATP-binding protein [Clostridium estertheticum]|uniref:ABC transporter ATP-binding protein n=1 Tax=Clostridium estertheticum TaxID=238834 RepID=UPI0013E9827F|nr:ABC transporter ATP-binding protein [Clostridium estertheticum]MBZ9685565.1 ABC transporter ATP-binding protein [Clostridium estertheticum]
MLIAENLKKVYVSNIKKGFFKTEKTYVEAVKGINFKIGEGQIVGLLGINGAGKTTTIKMLSTLLTPTGGIITIDGMDAVKNSAAVKKKINMVAGGERMLYWRLTGRENLWYYGQLYNIEDNKLKKAIDYLLELVGLKESENIPVERYSKGMKQRLQIARGLINNPSYIFMDEPTLGLDAAIAKELREHVKRIAHEEGKSILLTSHYMPEVEELCEYIYIMDKGSIIAQGTPKELALIGIEQKVLCVELYSVNNKLHQDILKVCENAENCSVELDEDNKVYTLKSKKDLSNEIASVLLAHKMPIKTFYTKEPKLEDAIIKLSKGV